MTPPHRANRGFQSPHGFFGRAGGVSQGSFKGLNGSLWSGDNLAHADENRRRVATALGADHLLTAKQVHGSHAVLINDVFDPQNRPIADGLVTSTPGLAIGVLTADCIPILFEGEGVIGVAHAGWRGSLAGIIEGTVSLMAELGTPPHRLRAGIGPALRRDHFEVREDLRSDVLAHYPEAERHFSRVDDQHWLYDHIAFAEDRLAAAGVQRAHVADVGGDTLAQPDDYFSYRAARRSGQTTFGHNITAIALGAP